MPPRPLYDIENLDFDNPLYTIDDIRKINPQRHEMEQLTAVVYVDRETNGLVGYKDVTDKEFWCTGHMPGFPLMPGVILCECAAQLAGFYARKFDLLGGEYLGFGGMEDVRFRKSVFPNSRLVLAVQTTKIRTGKRVEFDFQGFVDGGMVFNGSMIGVPINRGTPL
ncbi:3-hydroxyacyl-ACP dehydratase FabZ family protein [Rubinisphaera italica]|nr:beta-hydroxyacyl-ACP dehydratase [Rubinisphaera italica]